VVNKENIVPFSKRNKILGLPVIRGFVTLLDSLIIGIKTLNYSASFFEEDEEPSKFEKWLNDKFKGKSSDIIMAFSLILSLVISVGVFVYIPTLVANLFKVKISSSVGLNIIEGVIRVVIFLLYIVLISNMKDIYRVFQYHGAEHKTIFCYENEEELTPENAKKYKRLHPRCGTNFMFLVMIVSILLLSLTPWNSIWERMLYRIILLPVVSGVAYELIKWMGKSDSIISKILVYPGLMLQKLTTKEPDLSMLEVAIKALKVSEGIEDVEDVEDIEDIERIEEVEDIKEVICEVEN
ncbi:MAG: DUF1385 domain-containing protein, partial [Clostridiaceae bacterium]